VEITLCRKICNIENSQFGLKVSRTIKDAVILNRGCHFKQLHYGHSSGTMCLEKMLKECFASLHDNQQDWLWVFITKNIISFC
jgi:hypothetical protein